MAKTYGLLPSQVVENATTFDIMVTDVYSTWELHKRNPGGIDQYNPDQLKQMMESRKNEG